MAAVKGSGYVTIQLALEVEDKGTDPIPSEDPFLPFDYFLVQMMGRDSSSSGQNSSVTLGKLFNLSDPQFSHLENRDNNNTYFLGIMRTK